MNYTNISRNVLVSLMIIAKKLNLIVVQQMQDHVYYQIHQQIKCHQ